ncbi:MAG: class I SAM-dependent methyltransferase [Candidatus Omnitrophota bacterium]
MFIDKLFCKLKKQFLCPICGYSGCFLTINPETGRRLHAQCPRCGALERHRIQYLVFKKISENMFTQRMSMLHFAPEECLKKIFKETFGFYVTADLYPADVDKEEDITGLTFKDNAFDIVFASHVLEHVKDDLRALAEVRRVLKPGGVAILPVPIIGLKTVEYPAANKHENLHVRSTGEDYYDKYSNYFSKVELYRSPDFDEKYQLYVYENRNRKRRSVPLRPLVPGERHIDIVPVCFK